MAQKLTPDQGRVGKEFFRKVVRLERDKLAKKGRRPGSPTPVTPYVAGDVYVAGQEAQAVGITKETQNRITSAARRRAQQEEGK